MTIGWKWKETGAPVLCAVHKHITIGVEGYVLIDDVCVARVSDVGEIKISPEGKYEEKNGN